MKTVYFENRTGNASKFYLMEEDASGGTFTATYGRIGTNGSKKTYQMAKWADVYRTRLAHGYVDVTSSYLSQAQSAASPTKDMRDGIKFNLTGIRKTIGNVGIDVYRIVATTEFETIDGRIIKKGDLGGWLQRENLLSQYGKCWVDDDAILLDKGMVSGNALITDSVICEGAVMDNAVVRGMAHLYPDSYCLDNCMVCDNAKVYGIVKGESIVVDCAVIAEDITVSGDSYIDY